MKNILNNFFVGIKNIPMKTYPVLKKTLEKFQNHFLQFFMLFMAVFLGFLADNLRDSFIEKRFENEMIASLIKDIELDKANIKTIIEFNEFRIKKLDSLSNLCFNYHQHKNDYELYEQYDIVNGDPFFFIPNEQTLSQLEQTGGLRLIKSKPVVREILKYDYRKIELESHKFYFNNAQNTAVELGLRLFNQLPFKQKIDYRRKTGLVWNKPFNDTLLNSDPVLIKEFANRVYSYQITVEYYNSMLIHTEKSADSLLVKLNKEYK